MTRTEPVRLGTRLTAHLPVIRLGRQLRPMLLGTLSLNAMAVDLTVWRPSGSG